MSAVQKWIDENFIPSSVCYTEMQVHAMLDSYADHVTAQKDEEIECLRGILIKAVNVVGFANSGVSTGFLFHLPDELILRKAQLDHATTEAAHWKQEAERLQAKLNAPDMFWDDADPECASDSPREIIFEHYSFNEIVQVQRAIRLPDQWGFLSKVDDEEDETHMFDTKEEAQKALDAYPSFPECAEADHASKD